MIKKLIFVILIIFSFFHNCLSQKGSIGTSPILFRGVILDASSKTQLGGSQIMINRSRSAISSENGTFSFYANKKDTIIFSMLGYKPASLIVNDTLSGTEFLTGVYLETDTIFIGEVIIIPKLTSLKAEIMNPKISSDARFENARSNMSIASYQGRISQGKLGDPASNYEFIRQQQKITAFEKGGIPSDKMVGLSPLLLIPAAYLLIHGTPEIPPPPKAQISSKDLDELQKRYMELSKDRK